MPPPGGPVVFGYLGQLTETKGVHTLLEAFSELGARGHRLVLGGRGPLLSEAQTAGAQVRALGWLEGDAKEEFFEQIDCLVVPSQWREIGPLVALEARGRGVPVLGARIGAVPENIDPRSAPLLFASGSVEGLVSSMRRFVADPETYAPSTDGGFGWTEHLSELIGLYDEALSLRGRIAGGG